LGCDYSLLSESRSIIGGTLYVPHTVLIFGIGFFQKCRHVHIDAMATITIKPNSNNSRMAGFSLQFDVFCAGCSRVQSSPKQQAGFFGSQLRPLQRLIVKPDLEHLLLLVIRIEIWDYWIKWMISLLRNNGNYSAPLVFCPLAALLRCSNPHI